MNMTLRPLPALLRQQRLALLCASSALLHLAVLAWLAGAPPRMQQAAARLTVQLSGMRQATTTPALLPAASMPATQSRPQPAPRRRTTAAAAAMDDATVAEVARPAPAPPAAVLSPGWDVSADSADSQAPHLPGFQAVQAPPPARLTYAVTTAAAGGAGVAGVDATLEWRLDEQGYRLSMTGVTGTFESHGQMSDNGFAPLAASGPAADGAIETVRFDWSAAQASFARSGAVLLVAADGQDRASMLMRLTGMGLAGAAQLAGTIELQVAGSAGLATVRFERIGDEEIIDTALGALATVHLAQLVAPGKPRLEVWLAPQTAWYPVRLKVTAADGSSATQTLTAFAAGATVQ